MKDVWYLPEDRKGARKAVKKLLASKGLMRLLSSLHKASQGLSNYEALESISPDYASAMWVIKQAQSLGLIEYHVHPFGDFGMYTLTDQGKGLLSMTPSFKSELLK